MRWLTRKAEPDRLRDVIEQLGDDERRVLTLIAERLLMGQSQYGVLDMATDPRDWRKEALEECADGLVYAAVALMCVKST